MTIAPDSKDAEGEALVAWVTAEFSKKETMERLFRTVLPYLEEGKRTLVYILAQVDRIGHTAMEPLFLKTLFHGQFDRILLLTAEGSGPGYNPYILPCAGAEFVQVTTPDPVLPVLGFLDGGILDLKLFHLCLASPQLVTRDFGRAIISGAEMRPFELTGEIVEIGDRFMRELGKPEGAPFVCLHARDMSYMPDKAHHAFRCADLSTYGAAIRAFVEAGYWVFRLGDAKSAPLENMPREVVDLPHHPGYSQALDIYVSARCAFAFNQASGPEALVRAFGRPAATVNLVYEILRLPFRDDLLLFKDYVSAETGARLSYEEILERDLPAVGSAEAFAEQGIVIRDNTPEELEDAARLMISRDRDEGGWMRTDFAALDHFRALGAAYEVRLLADPDKGKDNSDFYAYAHDWGAPVPSVLARDGYLGQG